MSDRKQPKFEGRGGGGDQQNKDKETKVFRVP